MKLISMVDYIFKQNNEFMNRIGIYENESIGTSDRIYKYARFLKQPLTLGMFVPCDLDGNVLEEPSKYESVFGKATVNPLFEQQTVEYQQAKERVLFKGFVLNGEENVEIISNGVVFFWHDYQQWIVEDLIRYSIELTQSAQKQLQ